VSAWALALGLGTAAVAFAAPVTAHAGPRDDMRTAHAAAADQFNNLELDAALASLDAAVARAEGAGLGSDPMLAPLHTLRGGIIFSNTGNRAATLAAFKQAIACDWNATLPIELRSPDLQKILEEARRSAARPSNDAFVHQAPGYNRGTDVEFNALANVQLPDGAQIVLYWRKAGDKGEFIGESMSVFGNAGTFVLSASKHGDSPLQYFFYAFDAKGSQTLANRGDKERPMLLEPSGEAPPPGTVGGDVVGGGDEDGGDEGGEPKPKKPKKPGGKSKLPRVFINIGLGTGFGIARGTAELTYQQFTPGPGSTSYGTREQACAIERWYSARAPLATNQVTFGAHLNEIAPIPGVLPEDAAALTAAYDPDYCSARHPVTTGLASAPFHLAPEIGVRVSKRIVLSLFGRLQVVTGSKVFTEDPGKMASDSFNTDVRSPNPAGVQRKPPFSWALGLKFKYFFGKEDKKFRVFAGGFAGFGASRLRVNMGFSNDRNGNSVPDAIEVAYSGPADPVTQMVDIANCTPVWPYAIGCEPDPVPPTPPDDGPDRLLADSVAANTPATDTRIDTVVLGPGFVGGLVGFNYQIVKNFAIFAELGIGGWFPKTTSVLFDLTLGPVITF
jgi:hypothetical protein